MPEIIKILMTSARRRRSTQSLADEEVELIAAEIGREITIKHAAEEELEPEDYEDDPDDLAAARRSSRSWATSTTARRRCSTRFARAPSSRPRPAGSPSTSAPTRSQHGQRKITFLDTPGHEAFTAMRARGAKVTDIAVLVVAADDGVMPQTKESISHARAAEVPIVVAVNKVDLPESNTDRIRTELAAEGLQPEEWGGTTQFSEVSAKQGEGLDDLLEKVLLVADAELELKANPRSRPRGRSSSRGSTSAGARSRRCSSSAEPCASATRSSRATPGGRCARSTTTRARRSRRPGRATRSRSSASTIRRLPASRPRRRERAPGPPARAGARRAAAPRAARRSAARRLAREAVRGAPGRRHPGPQPRPQGRCGRLGRGRHLRAAKIQHAEVRVNVIHQGVGGITEDDIMLAAASNAMVVGFNVRPNAEARALADREGVEIRTYRVIYQLTEDIEQALVGMLAGRDRGDDRRGRGAATVPRLAARHDRRFVGHDGAVRRNARSASSATAPSSTRRRSRS